MPHYFQRSVGKQTIYNMQNWHIAVYDTYILITPSNKHVKLLLSGYVQHFKKIIPSIYYRGLTCRVNTAIMPHYFRISVQTQTIYSIQNKQIAVYGKLANCLSAWNVNHIIQDGAWKLNLYSPLSNLASYPGSPCIRYC